MPNYNVMKNALKAGFVIEIETEIIIHFKVVERHLH